MNSATRPEINRALAKALAYAEIGQADKAARWGQELARLLASVGVHLEEVRSREALDQANQGPLGMVNA